ncbi:unnamed protein product [Sphagnum balticum]
MQNKTEYIFLQPDAARYSKDLGERSAAKRRSKMCERRSRCGTKEGTDRSQQRQQQQQGQQQQQQEQQAKRSVRLNTNKKGLRLRR